MNRRLFLNKLTKIGLLSLIPIHLLKEEKEDFCGPFKQEVLVLENKWFINPETKSIGYVGEVDQGYNIKEVYSFLKNEWETEEKLNSFKFPIKTI